MFRCTLGRPTGVSTTAPGLQSYAYVQVCYSRILVNMSLWCTTGIFAKLLLLGLNEVSPGTIHLFDQSRDVSYSILRRISFT